MPFTLPCMYWLDFHGNYYYYIVCINLFSVGLVQPYLALQLVVPDGTRIAIELSVVDKSGSRRRIQLSSSLKEIAATPLNARVPLIGLLTGQVSLLITLRILNGHVLIVHG